MNTKIYSKPYLDSSVFIAHIKRETKVPPGEQPRWEITEQIMTSAERGQFVIWTSAVTIAEVRRIGPAKGSEQEADTESIRQFFENSWIQPVDVTRDIAENAQELGERYALRPMDALHLATALSLGCDILFAWDQSSFLGKLPSAIGGLDLSVPYWVGQATLL